MIEHIYNTALHQNPGLGKIDKEEILRVIDTGLHEIERLENAANPQNAKIFLTKEVAENIVALWDFSGPGVYDGPDRSDDRYVKLSWSRGIERARLNYTAVLARNIAQLLQPETDIKGPKADTKGNISRSKEIISQSGPTIIYNGTMKENERVMSILGRDTTIIPSEKVIIMDNEHIDSTNDQVKTMVWPKGLYQPGKEIGLISSAPHLWRIAHVLNQYKTIPAEMKIRLFPIPTPKEGKEQYAAMEIMGLLYYAYIGKSAKTQAYPYIIHGDKENKI